MIRLKKVKLVDASYDGSEERKYIFNIVGVYSDGSERILETNQYLYEENNSPMQQANVRWREFLRAMPRLVAQVSVEGEI